MKNNWFIHTVHKKCLINESAFAKIRFLSKKKSQMA
jgi:hypothetical protein